MIAILLQRPIAVLLSCTLAVVAGLISLQHLPVSLLPDTEAPRITVQVRLPQKPAEAIEQSALKPLREALARTIGLKQIRSLVSTGQGFIYLGFEYGTDMEMASLEVNERIDRALGYLPREMPRPLVVRSNVSDIPIFELQVIPKGDGDLTAISTLVDRVVRRKLEQLPGVSLVDVNGLHKSHILLRPKRELLHALGISEGQIVQTLRSAYREYGSFSIKNGHYQYFLRFENMADSLHKIGELPVLVGSGRTLPLSTLVTMEAASLSSEGFHLYKGKKSLGIQICKQADARMDEVAPQIRTAVEEMRRAYPQADFILTRDQSHLLNASIHNLYQVIGYGALLSGGILFLFLGNFTAGVIVGLSIPVSILITLSLFHLCGLSLNILSLSGLALGVGMLIDHTIIVLDAISRKAGDGLGLLEAGIRGTGEVLSPVLGQILTSVAVYGPLILLPGISGILVYEQALALSLCLLVSLIVAFILVPLLCRMLLASSLGHGGSETRFFRWLQQKYHQYIEVVTLRKACFMALATLFILSGAWVSCRLPVEGLPAIKRNETLLKINWREPLTSEENLRRMLLLDTVVAPMAETRMADVGALQYMLSVEGQTANEAQMYYACASSKVRIALDKRIEAWIKQTFPLASFQLEGPPNALNQIFPSSGPLFEVRIRGGESNGSPWSFHQIYAALADFPLKRYRTGNGGETERGIFLSFDQERMAIHRMNKEVLLSKLGTMLGGGAEIEASDEDGLLLRIHREEGSLSTILQEGIRTAVGGLVPLSHFIRYWGSEMPGQIAADQSGPYYSLELDAHIAGQEASKDRIRQWANQYGLEVQFSGAYFEAGDNLYTLAKIGAIVLLLLYFILALQFDHLLLPLVIMSALAFGASGAIWLLYLSGTSLNIMSGIGFVIVFGIILDDPILKVEVIQQHRTLFEAQGMATDEALKKAIGIAGGTCLKPMLMTTLTTCLSLVPVFFSPGIGSELQRPLALVVIGGLAVGTFFTSWCIPLLYIMVMKGASVIQK